MIIWQNGGGRINFLKVDVDGGDPFVLRGAARALADGRIESLFVELMGETLSHADDTPEDIVVMMEQSGFDACFCRISSHLQEKGQYRGLSAPVNNNQIQFTLVPRPVPNDFHGDALFLHRDTAIAAQVRSRMRRS